MPEGGLIYLRAGDQVMVAFGTGEYRFEARAVLAENPGESSRVHISIKVVLTQILKSDRQPLTLDHQRPYHEGQVLDFSPSDIWR
jgi:hypothetical protein